MPKKSKYIRVLRRSNLRITLPIEWGQRRRATGLTWNEIAMKGIVAAEHEQQYKTKDKA